MLVFVIMNKNSRVFSFKGKINFPLLLFYINLWIFIYFIHTYFIYSHSSPSFIPIIHTLLPHLLHPHYLLHLQLSPLSTYISFIYTDIFYPHPISSSTIMSFIHYIFLDFLLLKMKILF